MQAVAEGEVGGAEENEAEGEGEPRTTNANEGSRINKTGGTSSTREPVEDVAEAEAGAGEGETDGITSFDFASRTKNNGEILQGVVHKCWLCVDLIH
mmetsp:Transcript_1490/g.2800  ORF Transcript_1490/g.2800 Transcript_1490/m.2800 type:complete len:97 (-) Transcript_1490:20-310(-)